MKKKKVYIDLRYYLLLKTKKKYVLVHSFLQVTRIPLCSPSPNITNKFYEIFFLAALPSGTEECVSGY